MAEFNKEEIDYEDQLRQSERERKDLKNIIYELPVGLITVKGGNELTIDIANHEFCRMSGYRSADFSMEKMCMAQLIHMEDYMMFEDAAEVCRRAVAFAIPISTRSVPSGRGRFTPACRVMKLWGVW